MTKSASGHSRSIRPPSASRGCDCFGEVGERKLRVMNTCGGCLGRVRHGREDIQEAARDTAEQTTVRGSKVDRVMDRDDERTVGLGSRHRTDPCGRSA